MDRLKFDAKKCTGCHLCEVACSGNKEKAFNASKARLWIDSHYATSSELTTKGHLCTLCQLCVKKCPTNAISLQDGHLVVDHAECVNCNVCVETCPQKVIKVNAKDEIVICDLCNGDPVCAKWCPHGAISYAGKEAGGEA